MYNIKRANLNDENKLINLVKPKLLGEKTDENAKNALDEFLKDDNFRVFILREDEALKGFCSIEIKSSADESKEESAEIVMMNVNIDSKEKSYKKMLLEYVNDYLKQIGIKEMYAKVWRMA
ncbi:GNAT family N-acetyltransferase [Clostridium neuense]|uniref:GNAT family N-acetyltransferase n=1 Tax=Clostridium neuense TaxID=1728934 RepID=A0ABW8TIK7_9CLOT